MSFAEAGMKHSRRSRCLLGATLLALGACGTPVVPLLVAPPPAVPAPADTPPVGAVPIGTGFARATAAPLSIVTSCNLEALDAQPFGSAPSFVRAGKEFIVAGYAFDAQAKVTPAELRLRAIAADGSAVEATMHTGRERPDVPAYFGIGPWARRSGFVALLPSAGLAPGEYRLLLTWARGGELLACDNGRRLRVGR
jgi:hypothetical protein